MKIILLFVILALSINAFAQSNQPKSATKYPTTFSFKNIEGKIDVTGSKTPALVSKKSKGPNIKYNVSSENPIVQLLDSTYQWQWDTIINEWVTRAKRVDLVYDANNNVTRYTWQIWNNNTWVNSSIDSLIYDENNNKTIGISRIWNGSFWEGSSKNFNTYDANNNLTSNVVQIWNGISWANWAQLLNTFDASNNLVNLVCQIWEENTWVNYWQNTYTFNNNNEQTSSISQNWVNNIWINSYQTNNTYDASIIQSSLYQRWNDTIWINRNQDVYGYDANNNVINFQQQEWSDSAWKNFLQNVYTYDSRNNKTTDLYQNWSGSEWVSASIKTNTYDSNNFQESNIIKYWNNTGTRIIQMDSTYNYHHLVYTSINDNQETGVKLYPNPGNGKFTISSKNPIKSVEIYSITGEQVYSDFKLKQELFIDIDLSKSPKGIYIVKLNTGTKEYCGKIITQSEY